MAGLIVREEARWNEPLLNTMFDDQRVKEILTIHIGLPSTDDRLVWVDKKSGTYTVKSG